MPVHRAARVASLLAAIALPFATRPALAAWPHPPGVNLAVCTATQTQGVVSAVSDVAGGTYVVWQDSRASQNDIYAHHILASGALDPSWPVNGLAVCTATASQSTPVAIADGLGGAIIAWTDQRTFATTNNDIYAQRIIPTGVDPVWPVNGRALTVNSFSQTNPGLASDGAGGAVVAWQDARSGNNDIYAMHVLVTGVLDGAWTANGLAIAVATGEQGPPRLVPDLSGGAIITWHDGRGVTFDIYAHHVVGFGYVDTGSWTANGVLVCAAAGAQQNPRLIADGAGGAVIAWEDSRGAAADIYAHHIFSLGTLDIGWPTDGRAVCTATANQLGPALASDGSSGVLLTWQDLRAGNFDIYAHHVFTGGALDPSWPADGLPVCTVATEQSAPVIDSDGAGGVFIAWQDFRSGNYDIYAQHVMGAGALDSTWPATGALVCNAAGAQGLPSVIADGTGGAVLAWQDQRPGPADVYAQRIARHGVLGSPEPAIFDVRDVANDQGGKVNLAWNASWLDAESPFTVDHYWIFRSMVQSQALAALRGGARVLRVLDREPAPGEHAIFATTTAATTYYWEYLASQAAYHFLPGYGYTASTQGDSTGNGNPKTAFMVVAFNAAATQYWLSAPDSGYSVDNLGPAAPAPFTGQYAGGSTALHWNPNAEPDLEGYRLYRGHSPGFAIGPGSLVASLGDTGYVDAAGGPAYYKLTAVDLHGNESPVAFLEPAGTTDVAADSGGGLAFARPAPNPARRAVTLAVTLPRAARVSLAIFDVSGARVRVLAEGARAAGDHPIAWDLRDDRGARVPTGLYFARLVVEGRTLVQRVAVLE